jgi:opacity protein-like surface antigen
MKKTLIGLALLGVSTSVFAESLIHGGASVGQSDYKGEHGDTYSIYAGVDIIPFVAGIEGGLTKFDNIDTPEGSTTEATSAYLAVKPTFNFGPLSVYAKAGLHSWDEKIDGAKVDDGVDLMYGLGAEYSLMGPISFGANYQVYHMDGDDMKTFNLTATFHFM